MAMNANAFPVIKTERLLLTLPQPDAAPQMLLYFEENREHLAPWSPLLPPGFYTEAYWRERLTRARTEFEQGQSLQLVINARDEPLGRVVGVCNFSNFVRGAFQACYLGYSIGARDEGRGLMREALTAAIEYAFADLKLHRIMANYVPANERSGQLLRRLGFTVEGYARDYLLIAGQWRDHVLTSLTNARLQPGDVS
ncbi:MAG: [ribosomal protein S5]-alanine N-acetyltransferase [Blastocatellia bacterium]|nr:[ribosomal protein S5]-alanine N-acetyltransferase [Blastocatellia bacterium]